MPSCSLFLVCRSTKLRYPVHPRGPSTHPAASFLAARGALVRVFIACLLLFGGCMRIGICGG